MRLWSAAAVAVLVLSAGCGGDDSSDAADTPGSATSAPAGDATASAPDDICAVLSDTDVSAAVGKTLTANQDPGGGCTYKPEDPRDLSVSVTIVPTGDNGGFDGYVAGLGSTFKDVKKTELSGVGDQALVAVGETVYGGSHQAGAVAEVSGLLVTANAIGGTDDVLADAATKTLTIAVEKLG